MVTQLDDRLADATLSEAKRNTVRRFVALMDDALGDDLRGLWPYGSRARGEVPREGRTDEIRNTVAITRSTSLGTDTQAL